MSYNRAPWLISPLLTLLFTLLWLPSLGQSSVYVNYSIAQGLPSSETYEVYEDKTGFIWIATDNGVAKFDGSEFQLFHLADGLTDPVVFGFYEDWKSRLWFRTFSGKLSYMEDGKIKKYKWNDQLEYINRSNVLLSFSLQGEDLWFSTGRSMGTITAEGSVTDVPHLKGFITLKLAGKDILLSGNGSNNIDKLKVDDNHVYSFNVDFRKDYAKGFYFLRKGKNIYFTVNSNVFRYDGSSVVKLLTAEKPIVSLSTDHDGNFWVGYRNGGVQRFSGDQFTHPFTPEFLRNKSVTKVLQDKEGGFWFSTLENGIYYAVTLDVQKTTFDPPSKIMAAISTRDKVFTGDQNGVVSRYDPVSKTIDKKITLNGPILSVFEDNRQNIWSSTVDMFILDKDLTRKHHYINHNAIGISQIDSNNVWTVSGRGLWLYNNYDQPTQKWLEAVARSMIIHDSLLIVSYRTGMEIMSLGLKSIYKPEELKNYKISGFTLLSDSQVLVSTIGSGFLVLDLSAMSYKAFDAKNQFVANNIFNAVKTDSSVWMSTEKGLAVVTLNSLKAGKPDFVILAQRYFLMDEKINKVIFHAPNIWAFSDNGLFLIPEEIRKHRSDKPGFYIKNIAVNNKPVDSLISKLTLSHSENNISINFGFVAFSNPNILIRYKLSSSDPWTYSSQRSLQFYALQPNQYSLILEYSTDNIHWTTTSPFNFTISPPWWRTWYFIGGCFVVALGIAFLIFRLRESTLRQKHLYLSVLNTHQQELILAEIETLERERSRIAKDLHDSIGTNLTAIKMSTNTLLKKHDEQNASIIEEQLQSTIYEIKNIIYDLVPPGLERYGLIAGLKNYIEKLKPTLEVEIDFYSFGKEIKNPKISILSFRIVQELISNSLKHARANTITLHINSFKDSLNIVYEDDGIGFQENHHSKGSGLLNIESRIQSIQGTIQFEAGEFGVSYIIEIPITES